MSTAKEKLDALGNQMRNMLLLMEQFNRWHPKVDQGANKLHKEVKTLTSRVEALEAHTTPAPSPAPSREEEGRAKGHSEDPTPQGPESGAMVL
jgi:hypothetical protein